MTHINLPCHLCVTNGINYTYSNCVPPLISLGLTVYLVFAEIQLKVLHWARDFSFSCIRYNLNTS